jgi:hypothetical protein
VYNKSHRKEVKGNESIMAQRTGFQQFLKLCHRICVLLGVWQATIITAIGATALTTEQKAELVSLVNAVNTACDAMVQAMTRYEL